MDWQITPYTIGLGLAMLISLYAANLALRHKDQPAGKALGLMLIATAQWCGCYIIEANAITLAPKILWSQIAYIGTLAVGPLLFHFAIQLTHRDALLKPAIRVAVWAIPCITIVLAMTNGWHGLVWSGFTFRDATHRILIYERGAWFWVFPIHSYILLVITSALLAKNALEMRHIYRGQSLTILISIIPPWVINVIYLLAPALLDYRDWTPVGFAATGVLLTWAFRSLSLLDLMPIARDLVVEHMQEGVLVLDATDRIVDANAAAQRLIQKPSLIGRQVRLLFAELVGEQPDPKSRFYGPPETDPMISEDAPHHGEIVTVNGQTLTWEVTPLFREAGLVAGHILLLRNVSEERAAQHALADLNAKLEAQVDARTAEIRAAQEQSDIILRSVKDAIIMIDQDLVIRYANPAFTTITGYTYDHTVGTLFEDLNQDDFYARLKEVQAAERIWQGEIRIQHANGQMIDLAVTITPIHDGDEIAGYVCTGQDIGRLMNLVRTRKGILDNISHQLRTPVTTLRLYAHLLSKTDLSEAQERTLSVIDEQTARLQHMIEDILEMTSLESGATIGNWEAIPAAHLVDLVLERYQSQIAQAGLHIVPPDTPPTSFTIQGDRNRLAQALGEIVSNAIQFNPPDGTLSIAIAKTELEERPTITIAVTDTGYGIPLDEQPRVFERFFRGHITDSGQIPGTGLGLNIAATIIEAHGGHITLKSDETGSTFTLWLPEAKAEKS